MDELKLNDEFFKNRKLKSFIRVGTTFIDIKQTIGFSFIQNPEPNGYLVIQFVYDTGRVMNALLSNRNEFLQFLLELDPFIDDKNTIMPSIEKFIDEVEDTFIKQTSTRKRKQNKSKGDIN